MPSPSKTKGSRHEREVADILSGWWGSGEGSFRRVPNSGALRWNGAAWTYGDVYGPEDFVAVVECKFYSELAFQSPWLEEGKGTLLGWWSQACNDAHRARTETRRDLFPILIFRQNRVAPFLALPQTIADNLPVSSIVRVDVKPKNRNAMSIFRLSEWLQCVTKDTLLGADRTWSP